MGPAFVILFWAILAGIFGFFWLVSLFLFVIGWRKKKNWLKWLGLIPLVGLTVVALIITVVISIGIVRGITPKYVYTDTFGERPSHDVTNIKSKVWSFADEADVHIQFQTSPETFHRLIPKDLERVTFEKYKEKMPTIAGEESAPKWWLPVTQSTSEIYLLSTEFGKGKRFATETILMTYDAPTRTAQYYYIGID